MPRCYIYTYMALHIYMYVCIYLVANLGKVTYEKETTYSMSCKYIHTHTNTLTYTHTHTHSYKSSQHITTCEPRCTRADNNSEYILRIQSS